MLRWNGILSPWCFRSSLFVKVKLEYQSGSFVLILKSLLFTVQHLLRAAVNMNSGIPPLCLEFLCYWSVTGGVDVRGSYLIFLSVFIKSKSWSPLSRRSLRRRKCCWRWYPISSAWPGNAKALVGISPSDPQCGPHLSHSVGTASWPRSNTYLPACSWGSLSSVSLTHLV